MRATTLNGSSMPLQLAGNVPSDRPGKGSAGVGSVRLEVQQSKDKGAARSYESPQPAGPMSSPGGAWSTPSSRKAHAMAS
jgi:hypothetical protein